MIKKNQRYLITFRNTMTKSIRKNKYVKNINDPSIHGTFLYQSMLIFIKTLEKRFKSTTKSMKS